jgi:NAD(P)-dependent dehydrogenase (short-subunit alcohol dehydrogenase family)
VSGPLAGLNAVVTGASRGIGEATARRLAAEGANVVVNSSGSRGTDRGPLDAVVASINDAGGGRAVASCGDVADDAYAAELITTCLDEFGSIEVLANIAGFGSGPGQTLADDPSPELWGQLIGVHLDATFNCCRHAVPHMRANGGSIINTTSHSFLGLYGGTGYSAGKGGVVSLTWGMARDLRSVGIRANAVAPGAQTDLSSGPEYERQIWDLYERGVLTEAMRDASLRVAGPEFVAPMYVWLAGPGSVHVTGQVFSVTGNFVGRFPKPKETLITERPNAEGPWALDELDSLVGDALRR